MQVATYQTEAKAHHGQVDFYTLRIRGEVTMDGAPALRELLLTTLEQQPFPKIVLALSDLERIDSAGAAVLVEAVLLGRKLNKQVLLCSPSETVMKTFHLAGIEEALGSCCPTPDVTWQRLHA